MLSLLVYHWDTPDYLDLRVLILNLAVHLRAVDELYKLHVTALVGLEQRLLDVADNILYALVE